VLLLKDRWPQLLWGPLSFATAICIARGSSLRYPLQIIVSLAHLYGVALYYSTCYAEHLYRGVSYSRPEILYFWGYYAGFNAPWVVVPASERCFPSRRSKVLTGRKRSCSVASVGYAACLAWLRG